MLSEKPWQPLAVLQYCLGVMFCICAGGLLNTILGQLGVAGFRHTGDFGRLVLGTCSFQGSACLLILVFFWWHKVRWRDGFGFTGPNLKRALLLALLVFVIALPSVWLIQSATVLTLERLGHPVDDQTAVQLIANAPDWWTRGYLAFFAVVMAPVSEEFLFRGVLYPFVKQLGWPKAAWFGVSLVFALIHFDLGTFPALFLLALLLTWLYEKTDNLLAPMLVHSLFNAANLGMLVLKHFHLLPES